MSVTAKRLVNDYEEGILEFLQTCVGENYKIHTQVSLIQICEPDSILDDELKSFFIHLTSHLPLIKICLHTQNYPKLE